MGVQRGGGAALRGTGGGDAESGGGMGTLMQGGNGAASIGARRWDERIRSLGERRVRE